MVKDAEAHAEEDRKVTELVSARNTAEGMINATEKSVEELGEKVSAEEKTAIEAAIEELNEAVKGDDKEAIEAKTTALTELSGKLAERAYAQQAGAEEGNSGSEGSVEQASAEADDSVVDAEFEEVKDDDKK
jgi:molecular chaperone DnaK